MNEQEIQKQNEVINEVYHKTLYLLNLNEGDMTIEEFNRYEGVISMILRIKGVDIDALTNIQIEFLFYLYCGCECMKKGVISIHSIIDTSYMIKREKRVDLEIEYQKLSDLKPYDTSSVVNKTYCQLFDEYLQVLINSQVEHLATSKHCIGIANAKREKCFR